MDTVKCPVCGQMNPANAVACQNCKSRLAPLTGPLNEPLQAGEIPTKKVTAELEPILPLWLREAREKARQSASEEEADTSFNAENNTPTVPSAPDLLAGLASQSNDEEEEVPDWLTSLTGSAPAKKKKNEPEAEDTQVKWVELGGHEDFEEQSPGIGATQTPSETPVQNTTPSWMAPQEPGPEKDELADWFSRAGQSSASFSDQAPASSQPAESPLPAFSTSKPEDEDWLKNLESKPFGSTPDSAPQLSDQPMAFDSQSHPTTVPASGEPDWLNKLQAQQSAVEPPSHPAQDVQQPASSQPDWLGAAAPKQSEPAASAEVPDWLKAFGQTPAASEPSAAFGSSSDLPDWLNAAAPQPSAPLASKPAPDVEKTPDWLSSLKPVQPQPSTPPADSKAPAFAASETPQPPAATSAFADEPTADVNMNELFASMQAPDWLTSAAPKDADPSSSETNPPSSAQTGEAIAPAELPSWIQAMRPVESPLSASPTSGGDSSAEAGGPLAGLQNVLPAGAGFPPTSKPKAYSIKLNATNEHQTQAALLEQILAAETAPIPMKVASVVMSQRILRWVITALMFLLVGGIVLTGTQIFALPARVPNDQTERAISAVSKIPAGAPVLVVFDYEPSLSGEMQTIAEPYLNRLLLLKHPRLTILSSSPTGSALAENFMAGPLAGRGYQRGKQYIDLGYLPGGLAGVYDFAQNPPAVMPLGADGAQVWQTAPLQGVTRFSDFAAVILLTDSAEAGRVWIEQAGPLRGNASLVIVSSSQAGPILMPYVASGQVNGLVNGLNDASKVEQANGQPGLARLYWDAYSVGLLLAAAMIILGGLWNLVPGLRARRAEKEES